MTPERREEVIRLRDAGLSVKNIAEALSEPWDDVHSVCAVEAPQAMLSRASAANLAAAVAKLEAERDDLQTAVSVTRELLPLHIVRLAELNAGIATIKALPQLGGPL